MTPLVVTLLIVLAFGLVLIVYDCWLARTDWRNTISWRLWVASTKRPLIPFVIGMVLGLLAGHFFWQMQE